MRKLVLFIGIFISSLAIAQIEPSRDLMMFYTSEWEGERFEDGRPKVPDSLMDRLLKLSIEEIWSVLRNKGYFNQYEGDWEMLHPDRPFSGRALTAVYMPSRPDVNDKIMEKGKEEGRIGASNSWPIDRLRERDVYVAAGYGKVVDGTLIGDNLGNSIYSRSKTGVVFDAGARDAEGLSGIEGFNAFTRGFDPSYITNMMLTGINIPTRIGRATCVPGDVVVAKKAGVIFVPSHLVEEVILTGEFIQLKDAFGHQMLREGIYTPGQIDTRWTDEIKEHFLKWVSENPEQAPMSRKELDNYLKGRTW